MNPLLVILQPRDIPQFVQHMYIDMQDMKYDRLFGKYTRPNIAYHINGDANINLRIKNVADNTKESIPHTIPLDLTVSFPQNTTIFGQNVTLTNTEAAKTRQGHYFSVTTLPDLEAKDYINNLAVWLSPLNSIWAFLVAVGTVTIPLLLRLFSKQKQKDTYRQSQS